MKELLNNILKYLVLTLIIVIATNYLLLLEEEIYLIRRVLEIQTIKQKHLVDIWLKLNELGKEKIIRCPNFKETPEERTNEELGKEKIIRCPNFKETPQSPTFNSYNESLLALNESPSRYCIGGHTTEKGSKDKKNKHVLFLKSFFPSPVSSAGDESIDKNEKDEVPSSFTPSSLPSLEKEEKDDDVSSDEGTIDLEYHSIDDFESIKDVSLKDLYLNEEVLAFDF